MKYQENVILLNRKQSIVVSNNGNENNHNAVMAIIAEIAQFGYTLDKSLIEALSKISLEELKIYKEFLVKELSLIVGSHVKYVPLFINFPNNLLDTEFLYQKKILGIIQNLFNLNDDGSVLSCGHFIDTRLFNLDNYSCCPVCEQQDEELYSKALASLEPKEKFSFDAVKLKVIKLTSEDSLFTIFKNLLSANTSISENDKEVISYVVKNYKNKVEELLPEKISQKEIIAYLSVLLMANVDNYLDLIKKYNKTSVDILRLAVSFSNGDISLAEKTKFKLSNKQRKLIMSLLNNVNNAEVDMLRYREEFLRLGEVLHIGSFKNKYKNTYKSFQLIRNNSKDIETFSKKVEFLTKSLKETKDRDFVVKQLVNILSTREGEFARKLDLLLRNSDNKFDVVSSFITVISKVKTPILLTLLKHFQHRSVKKEYRSFLPKGSFAKIKYLEGDDRETIDILVCNEIVSKIREELITRFSKKESLGNVLLSKELMDVLIPSSQRSATKSLLNIPRGSRIKLDNKPFIRLYTYWKHYSDVDLTACCYDKDLKKIMDISYYNLRGFGKSIHSGDIRNGRLGATEFIDLDIEEFKKRNIKYVSVLVYSFSGEKFSDMECFAGFMEKDSPDSNQFDATQLVHKFNISSPTTQCIPMMFDIENNEFIWMDISVKNGNVFANGVNTNKHVIEKMKSILDFKNKKSSMFDLLELHSLARATRVDYEKVKDIEYDTVFDIEILKDIDVVMSKYLES